jgi:TnpA family transposase
MIRLPTTGSQDHGYAPVYGLAFLLGIKLMPRIRNWKDLKWFRPTLQEAYKNIDPLFTKEAIDWDLIERHLPDMLLPSAGASAAGCAATCWR